MTDGARNHLVEDRAVKFSLRSGRPKLALHFMGSQRYTTPDKCRCGHVVTVSAFAVLVLILKYWKYTTSHAGEILDPLVKT